LVIGVGMVPRGEVGIIVASLGQSAGVFSGTTYAIIIAMSLLTSIAAPPVLKALFAGDRDDDTGGEADEVRHLTRVDESGLG
jgi:Kef-type K+ transport system membrane component KefB